MCVVVCTKCSETGLTRVNPWNLFSKGYIPSTYSEKKIIKNVSTLTLQNSIPVYFYTFLMLKQTKPLSRL